KVYIYRFPPQKKAEPLSPAEQPFIKVRPESGPRHLTFDPKGDYAYLINELNSTITVFRYNSGELKTLQTISLLPEDFNGKAGSADIHVSPDGKFLYASNRDPLNDLAIFSINEGNGKLKFVGRQHTLGKGARTFAIDPSG